MLQFNASQGKNRGEISFSMKKLWSILYVPGTMGDVCIYAISWNQHKPMVQVWQLINFLLILCHILHLFPPPINLCVEERGMCPLKLPIVWFRWLHQICLDFFSLFLWDCLKCNVIVFHLRHIISSFLSLCDVSSRHLILLVPVFNIMD